jgi:thioesterase domain-containing protein
MPPIYLISGITMDASTMQPLSKHFNKNQVVFGLEYAGLDYGTTAMGSIEEIASSNLEALHKIKATPPYIFCGYSFGGMVAFEMAKQLLALGETQVSIILIDAFAFDLTPKKDLDLQSLIETEYNIKINIPSGELNNKKLYNALKKAVDLKNTNKMIFTEFEEFERRIETLKVQQTITYNPPRNKLVLDTTLFRSNLNSNKNRFLGWDNYISNSIKLKTIQGDHISIMKEPNVKVLAQEIQLTITNR